MSGKRSAHQRLTLVRKGGICAQSAAWRRTLLREGRTLSPLVFSRLPARWSGRVAQSPSILPPVLEKPLALQAGASLTALPPQRPIINNEPEGALGQVVNKNRCTRE